MSCRYLAWICGVAAIAVTIAIYTLFDPATNFFPRCIFLQLTGVQCPGCGSQRAIHALLQGNIAAAWHHNALLVASIPAIVVMIISQIYKKQYPKLYNALNSRIAIFAWTLIIVTWWIFRNI